MNAVEQSFWGNFKASAEIKVSFWGSCWSFGATVEMVDGLGQLILDGRNRYSLCRHFLGAC